MQRQDKAIIIISPIKDVNIKGIIQAVSECMLINGKFKDDPNTVIKAIINVRAADE